MRNVPSNLTSDLPYESSPLRQSALLSRDAGGGSARGDLCSKSSISISLLRALANFAWHVHTVAGIEADNQACGIVSDCDMDKDCSVIFVPERCLTSFGMMAVVVVDEPSKVP